MTIDPDQWAELIAALTANTAMVETVGLALVSWAQAAIVGLGAVVFYCAFQSIR